MVINEYEFTALEASKAPSLNKRKAWPLNVSFNYLPPPSHGRNFRQYRKLKQHILEEMRYFTVLDDFELFRIIQAIEDGKVSPFWRATIEEFWSAKKDNKIITEITIGNGKKLEIW